MAPNHEKMRQYAVIFITNIVDAIVYGVVTTSPHRNHIVIAIEADEEG